MTTEYISIQEASEISQKSVQTIRRAIKAKKLNAKKSKTPQGFNYLIEKESLYSFYKIKGDATISQDSAAPAPRESKKTTKRGGAITKDDIREFTLVMERLISQHADERQNFLRLINTLQEKIFFLENQLNLLKAPDKRWYQFWR